jgi:DNA-binding MarR family transcriptional regulator
MAAVTSLMRAQQIVLARVEEVLRAFDLTFARYEVLMLLLFSRSGSLPLSRLGDRLQVHPTSVTNAVDRLEAQGLVRRSPHPSDRRATLAELTAAGRERAQKATEELNARVFAKPGLGPEGVDRLVEVLTELRRDAGDF